MLSALLIETSSGDAGQRVVRESTYSLYDVRYTIYYILYIYIYIYYLYVIPYTRYYNILYVRCQRMKQLSGSPSALSPRSTQCSLEATLGLGTCV